MVESLPAVRAGDPEVSIPVYSHLSYDIVPVHRARQVPNRGSSGHGHRGRAERPPSQHRDVSEHVVASGYFDLFVHVDAAEDVSAIAGQIWSDINLANLRGNIAPTAGHAHLVLVRDREHRVRMAMLRKTRAG